MWPFNKKTNEAKEKEQREMHQRALNSNMRPLSDNEHVRAVLPERLASIIEAQNVQIQILEDQVVDLGDKVARLDMEKDRILVYVDSMRLENKPAMDFFNRFIITEPLN